MKKKIVFIGAILLVGAVTVGLYLSPLNSWFHPGGNSGNLMVSTSVGGLAPDFEAVSLDGKTLQLRELRGKIVLLNLFASWCGPCLAETPHLVEVYDDNQDDLIILGMNFQETPTAVSNYRDEFNIAYPLVLDPEGRFVQPYRPVGLPTSWFVDPEGVICYVHSGSMTATMIRKILDDIRTGKQPDPFTSG
jgi:thiol-disulfide isomerase/thioredoxin